jgi:hypothetical protein
MLVLDDEQLALVKAMARPIPPAGRDAFMRRVASLLAGRSFSMADLRKAAAVAQHETLGVTVVGELWD